MSQQTNSSPGAENASDYEERVDITSLHAAVLREKAEPSDGNEPLALWMVWLFGITLFFGGGYLAFYSGGFRADEYSIYAGRQAPGSEGGDSGAPKAALTLAQQGERVFKQNCVACHQASGMGIPGQYPPLVGTSWVIGGEKRLGAIMINGIQGPLVVEGQTYNGAMPAWASLNDQKLAAVMTYIRSAWGNSAGEITEAQAAAARAEFGGRAAPWTGPELEAIPADAPLPGAAPAAAPEAAPAPDAAPAAAPAPGAVPAAAPAT